nr:hypothetical protein GCM10020185_47070 [Pseudomonas brassicacearum subsp. brassicacearum]
MAVALRYAADAGIDLVVIDFDVDLGRAVAVALHALSQVVLDGLFQGPVAKADDVAVIGEGKETGDAFGATQLYVNVGGVGGGTEGQGGKRKYGDFWTCSDPFQRVGPSKQGASILKQTGPKKKWADGNIGPFFYGFYGITGGK